MRSTTILRIFTSSVEVLLLMSLARDYSFGLFLSEAWSEGSSIKSTADKDLTRAELPYYSPLPLEIQRRTFVQI